jgi:hypothetical protein
MLSVDNMFLADNMMFSNNMMLSDNLSSYFFLKNLLCITWEKMCKFIQILQL